MLGRGIGLNSAVKKTHYGPKEFRSNPIVKNEQTMGGQIFFLVQYSKRIIIKIPTKCEFPSSQNVYKLSHSEKLTENNWLGGWGSGDRWKIFLEQYAKRIIVANHHTKFELANSKCLEVIPLRK